MEDGGHGRVVLKRGESYCDSDGFSSHKVILGIHPVSGQRYFFF